MRGSLKGLGIVLQATNGVDCVLPIAEQVRILVLVKQEHIVSMVAIAISGTPEVCEGVSAAEATYAVPAAGWERREAVGIRTIEILLTGVTPTRLRLEHFASNIFSSHSIKQRCPIRGIRQEPSFRAHATHLAGKPASFAVTAFIFGLANCSRPKIETTVLGAVSFSRIFSTATPAVFRFEVQVFRHPHLIANFHSLVSLTIAGIDSFTIINIRVQLARKDNLENKFDMNTPIIRTKYNI